MHQNREQISQCLYLLHPQIPDFKYIDHTYFFSLCIMMYISQYQKIDPCD